MDYQRLRATQLLRDLASDVAPEDLRERHRLNEADYHDLVTACLNKGLLEPIPQEKSTVAPRRIDVTAIVNDIRAGLSESEILERSRLEPRRLQSTFNRLLERRIITPDQLNGTISRSVSPQDHENIRSLERCYLDFELPVIVERENGETVRGVVRDLTHRGIGTVGIPASVGEVKTLTVDHDKFVIIQPFSFQAACRWVSDNEDSGQMLAGFEITSIDEADMQELHKLIRLVTVYC